MATSTAEPNGKALFLKRWLRRPLAMGAVVPSGKLLAVAIAQTALDGLAGRPDEVVVELGAGTGQVTRALLDAGLPASALVPVERDPELASFLHRSFAESDERVRAIAPEGGQERIQAAHALQIRGPLSVTGMSASASARSSSRSRTCTRPPTTSWATSSR